MRALIVLLVLSRIVLGCECRSLTPCEYVQQPILFIGEVIDGGVSSLREDPWYSPSTHVRFRVVEVFRGLPKDTKTFEMDIIPPLGMCSPNPYYPGHTYLVAPYRWDGKLMDGSCFTGRDVEKNAETVSYVREFFAGKAQLNIHGRVAATEKPLPGVRVATSRNGRTYSTLADSQGRYRLVVPEKGDYQVDAELSPYQAGYASLTVGEGGCAVRDFPLGSNSTISGKLWDGKGQPVQHVKVGLVDLDRRSEDDPYHLHAYPEQRDQSFLFKNVPVGRYLLVANPDGPRNGELFDAPFESTYFPLGSSRREAQVIQVTAADQRVTTMDLIIGKPVALRTVKVRVRFPDGAPMTTAQVTAIGDPVEDGGLPWKFRRTARKTGLVEFQAPVNRNLRIRVEDWYGRDLKRKYESTHEPGAAPIEHEFVVVP